MEKEPNNMTNLNDPTSRSLLLAHEKQLVNTNSKHTNKKCKKNKKHLWDFSCIFNLGAFEDFHTLFIVIQQSLHMPHNITQLMNCI